MKKSLIFLFVMLLSISSIATVSSTSCRTSASCNGSTTAFTFTFPIVDSSDLVVILRNTTTGAESIQTEVTNYLVSATNNDYANGGTVTTVGDAWASGQTVLILRDTPDTQAANLDDSGVLRLETVEAGLDKLTLLVQQVQEQVNRSIYAPRTDDMDALDMVMPSTVDRASQYLGFNSNGEPTVISSGITVGAPTVSSWAETHLDDATEAIFKATVNLEIGTDVQAYDTDLTALARGPWVDVTKHGAIPDDSTDDTTEIQAAIDTLTSGGMVFIPPGTYDISAELTFPASNIRVSGAGKATILTTASTTINMFKVQGVSAYPNDLRGIIIENLALQGPDSGTGKGIYVKKAHECIFRNLFLGEHSASIGHGIYFDGATAADADNHIIANNHITQTTVNGITILGGGFGEENTIIGNTITGSASSGIRCEGNRNTITGNTVEECGGAGILSGGYNNTIIGNTTSENNASGITILGSVGSGYSGDDNIIIGNIIEDNDYLDTATYHGIELVGTKYSIIMGNRCCDNDNYQISVNTNCVDCIVIGNNCMGTGIEGAIADSGTRTQIHHNFTNEAFDIASATTIAVRPNGDYFNITGTADITGITASYAGREVTLKFAGTAATNGVVDGSNLKLAGNFGYTPDDAIRLTCDGTNWYEVSRSAN